MMAFLQRISLMITSLIILNTIPSTISVSPDQPTMTLIHNICSKTVNAHSCEQSIIPKLENPHAEIKTIAKIAAFNALYLSKITVAVIRDDFVPKAPNPVVAQELHYCFLAYLDVERYLDGAYKAFLRNQFELMRHYQSYVLGLVDYCEPDYFAPMKNKNWWARLIINTSIVAAGMLPSV